MKNRNGLKIGWTGGWKVIGLDWWYFSWTLPLFMPLGTAGRRTWNDTDPGKRSLPSK